MTLLQRIVLAIAAACLLLWTTLATSIATGNCNHHVKTPMHRLHHSITHTPDP